MSDAAVISTEDYNKEEFEKISEIMCNYKIEDSFSILMEIYCQDFVAIDLQDGDGEYCPQFDSTPYQTSIFIPAGTDIALGMIEERMTIVYCGPAQLPPIFKHFIY